MLVVPDASHRFRVVSQNTGPLGNLFYVHKLNYYRISEHNAWVPRERGEY